MDRYTAKWVQDHGLDYSDQKLVRENIVAMLDLLKSQITALSPQDYVNCRSFLQSVLYATTRTVV